MDSQLTVLPVIGSKNSVFEMGEITGLALAGRSKGPSIQDFSWAIAETESKRETISKDMRMIFWDILTGKIQGTQSISIIGADVI
jgi:hypothetical protein